VKAALIQMNSQDDKDTNIAEAVRLIRAAVESERPDLVILPEYFACLGDDPAAQRASGEEMPNGETHRRLADLARQLSVVIHAGSMVERAGDQSFNTTVVFGRDGEELAKYRKIHLFDVVVPGGLRYLESETVARGSEIVTYKVGDLIIGCSICYDVRFPELFRRLRDAGADVIVLPAAFTLQTGKDHWEILLRARAIETQTYVLAAAQVGTHAGGRKACWGHSMAIDPWGHVIAQASARVGYVSARVDRTYTEEIRRNVPVHRHHILG
jgi:predicted amidohydrolase